MTTQASGAPTLICGSFAYDTIMVFQDQFKNHILPDKVHILNVSFQVPEMRREFGGCAGNIAYSLKLPAFHPGAMNRSHETRVKDANGAKLGIVSPDGREGMIQHARQFAEAGIPFIFDPGQGMPLFGGDDLMALLRQ